jgi:pullulanase/glycogen debranching enzyme
LLVRATLRLAISKARGNSLTPFFFSTNTQQLMPDSEAAVLNAYWEPLDFELPQPDKSSENPWHRWIDTALDSPHDIVQWETAESVPGYAYRTQARSVVVLFCGSLR